MSFLFFSNRVAMEMLVRMRRWGQKGEEVEEWEILDSKQSSPAWEGFKFLLGQKLLELVSQKEPLALPDSVTMHCSLLCHGRFEESQGAGLQALLLWESVAPLTWACQKRELWELNECLAAAMLLHKFILTPYLVSSCHNWGGFVSAANSRSRQGAAAGGRTAQVYPEAWAGTC